jgi:hypothetical protein
MTSPPPASGVACAKPGSAASRAIVWDVVASRYVAGCTVVGWWQGLPPRPVRIPRKGAPLGLLWRRATPDLAAKIIRAEFAGALAVQQWRAVPASMIRHAVVDEYVAALLLSIAATPDRAPALLRDLEREARVLTRHLEPTIAGLAIFLSSERCIGAREGRELLPFFLNLCGTAELKSPLDLPPALAVRRGAS